MKLGFEQKFEFVKILTHSIFTKYVVNKSAKYNLSTKELPRKQFSCTWCGYFNKEFTHWLWNWFSKKFQMRFTRIFPHHFLGTNNDGHEQGSRSLVLFYCDMHFFHLFFPRKSYFQCPSILKSRFLRKYFTRWDWRQKFANWLESSD